MLLLSIIPVMGGEIHQNGLWKCTAPQRELWTFTTRTSYRAWSLRPNSPSIFEITQRILSSVNNNFSSQLGEYELLAIGSGEVF